MVSVSRFNSLVRLIFCPKSSADSEISRTDIKITIAQTKSPTYAVMIPKTFLIEISAIIEISTDFVSRLIIEYQIFCFILPIVQGNRGQMSCNF